MLEGEFDWIGASVSSASSSSTTWKFPPPWTSSVLRRTTDFAVSDIDLPVVECLLCLTSVRGSRTYPWQPNEGGRATGANANLRTRCRVLASIHSRLGILENEQRRGGGGGVSKNSR